MQWLAFAPNVLVAVVYVVGIALAIVYMPRVGKAAVFTIIAMVLQLLASGTSVASFVIVRSAYERAITPAQLALTTGALGLVATVLHVLAFALLFVAIFARRDPALSG